MGLGQRANIHDTVSTYTVAGGGDKCKWSLQTTWKSGRKWSLYGMDLRFSV